jgi:RimJ/RimL family protein N-acetyltransferase
MSVTAPLLIRRRLGEGDVGAIVALHDRVYRPEYARNDAFIAAVAASIADAVAAGWPASGGGVWLAERDGEIVGSLGLTDEGDGVGQIRWVVIDPEARGHGLMRTMLSEALEQARSAGMTQVVLDTYSALTAAAHVYRSVGFEVTSQRDRDDWGPTITYQHYELDLSGRIRNYAVLGGV